jgi:hypothetical protein
MADPEDRLFDRAIWRIRLTITVLSVGGSLAALMWGGVAAGAGFAVGAAVSSLNFRWLHHVVDTIGGKRRARARTAVLAGLRYLLLGAGLYVIVRFFRINVLAGLLGLFVSVAAVILEMLYQLVYARN